LGQSLQEKPFQCSLAATLLGNLHILGLAGTLQLARTADLEAANLKRGRYGRERALEAEGGCALLEL
jgi:hypothetical protein